MPPKYRLAELIARAQAKREALMSKRKKRKLKPKAIGLPVLPPLDDQSDLPLLTETSIITPHGGQTHALDVRHHECQSR